MKVETGKGGRGGEGGMEGVVREEGPENGAASAKKNSLVGQENGCQGAWIATTPLTRWPAKERWDDGELSPVEPLAVSWTENNPTHSGEVMGVFEAQLLAEARQVRVVAEMGILDWEEEVGVFVWEVGDGSEGCLMAAFHG
ncbi:hypothetical protein Salat_1203200 [Sesamum alatum]|uniref:Uncharacterized protein n=1 Tax=Sesamum alatum TaxID=300844 RepID=A0AAE2CNV6_9LAMI|nr:hypothetical protein Salat_1203200 [Sesamum alatum]